MAAMVVYLQSLVGRLRERQEGQTMAEYALILGGIAVVVIAGILILGPAIRDLFSSTGSSVAELPELVAHRSTLGVGERGHGVCDRRPRFVLRVDRGPRPAGHARRSCVVGAGGPTRPRFRPRSSPV